MNATTAYVMWRFHVWANGAGSYNDIDRKVARGKLVPGVCDCGADDCPWTPPNLAPAPGEHGEVTKGARE
jgi:hypothetical protein